jgi:hypothetical protein
VPPISIEFDLDDDDLDDDTVAQTSFDHDVRPDREQSMPLLVGLLDASAVRRSLDIPMGVDYTPEGSDVDVEELVAKQGAGGGMLSSVANMANSILGAGAYPTPYSLPWLILAPPLKGSSVYHLDMLRYSYNSEHFVRFTLRHESCRVLYGNISLGRPFCHHRLDDPPHRAKRKTQRHEIIHRNHEPLFWFEWTRNCVLFSILFRIWWYVSAP